MSALIKPRKSPRRGISPAAGSHLEKSGQCLQQAIEHGVLASRRLLHVHTLGVAAYNEVVEKMLNAAAAALTEGKIADADGPYENARVNPNKLQTSRR
jgi:hypothetical protein